MSQRLPLRMVVSLGVMTLVSAWPLHGRPPGLAEFPIGNDIASARSIVHDADGNFVIVGHAQGTVGGRRFAGDGRPLTDEFLLVAENGYLPSAASDAHGNLAVIWHEPHGAYDSNLFARRFTAEGEPLSPRVPVNDFVLAWDSPATVGLGYGEARGGLDSERRRQRVGPVLFEHHGPAAL